MEHELNVLVVVDMQNDFIDGALGTPEAQAIVPNVKKKIEKAREAGWKIVFTQDTHYDNYLNTQEGKNLPVPHCIRETDGWRVSKELDVGDCACIMKSAFGSTFLMFVLKDLNPSSIEFVGLCTDICVISNAMMAKSFMPETKIIVDSSCCAGVTHESHENALDAMRMCQIEVI